MNEKDLITLDHDNAFTTSLIVAEKFGKRHDNVLKAILNLECSDRFRLLNFEESSYQNEQNKTQPMYQIRRDGFAFLAMGFTARRRRPGKRRSSWRLTRWNTY